MGQWNERILGQPQRDHLCFSERRQPMSLSGSPSTYPSARLASSQDPPCRQTARPARPAPCFAVGAGEHCQIRGRFWRCDGHGQSPGAGLIMYLLAHEGKRRCSVQKGHRTVDPIKYLDYPRTARARATDVSIHSQRTSLEKPDSLTRVPLLLPISTSLELRLTMILPLVHPPTTDTFLQLLSSHTSYEGAFFTNPRTIGNETALAERLREISLLIPERDVCYVPDTLRSPVYDGSQAYTTDLDREMLMANEMYFATTHQNLLQSMIRRDTEVYA